MGDIIGTLGVLSVLAAYFLSQRGVLDVHDPRYLWMNFIGATGIVISFFWAWNLSAFLMESAWAGISAWGLIRLKHKT